MKNVKALVETFHLLFLDQLSRNLDNSLYAVKGGCNLRFFFKSIRYSEDLDIDVHTIATDTLRRKIDRILSSMPLKQILKTKGITINKVSLPKQTETTQRWKLILQTPSALPINTKIEFSRREMSAGTLYEPIDPSIIQVYRLTPIFCTHYDKHAAFIQKINALAGRPQTQARDIFDLFLLINAGAATGEKNKLAVTAGLLSSDQVSAAQENALAISFDDFNSQVVVYLTSEFQAQYNSKMIWEQIVTKVFDQLAGMKS